MPTRTRYRRTRTGMAFGGAFWRFDPASQTPGLGGANAGGFEPPLPRAPAAQASNPISGVLAMGGSIVGTLPDGSPVVSVGGLFYNGRTGQQIQGGGAGAGATTTTAGTGGGSNAAAGGGATASSSRIGTSVTGRTSAGASVTGTITGTDANGNVIVQWQDGAVSTYDGTGKLISNTPAPGSTGSTGATGTDTGGGTPTTDTGAAPTGATGATATPTNTGSPVVTDPSNPNVPSTYSQPPETATATPTPTSPAGPVAAGNPAAQPAYIADQGVSGGLNGTAAQEPGLYQITPEAAQVFFPPPNVGTATGDTYLNSGVSYADVVGGGPKPSPAPIAAPQLYGDQYGNMVPLDQLLAGYDARQMPSTLDVAQTMAPPDMSAPTYPGFTQLDAGFVEPAPQPGISDFVPPPDFSAFAQ